MQKVGRRIAGHYTAVCHQASGLVVLDLVHAVTIKLKAGLDRMSTPDDAQRVSEFCRGHAIAGRWAGLPVYLPRIPLHRSQESRNPSRELRWPPPAQVERKSREIDIASGVGKLGLIDQALARTYACSSANS